MMKKILGLPMVYAGVAILAASSLLRPANNHASLLAGLALVVAGAIAHVVKKRKASNY